MTQLQIANCELNDHGEKIAVGECGEEVGRVTIEVVFDRHAREDRQEQGTGKNRQTVLGVIVSFSSRRHGDSIFALCPYRMRGAIGVSDVIADVIPLRD